MVLRLVKVTFGAKTFRGISTDVYPTGPHIRFQSSLLYITLTCQQQKGILTAVLGEKVTKDFSYQISKQVYEMAITIPFQVTSHI